MFSSSSSPESCSQDAEGTFSPENTLPRSDVMNGPFTSPLGMPASPAPRTVTDEEMNFVKTCLQRWRSEIEQDIQGWCSENMSAAPCLSCLTVWKLVTLGIHAVITTRTVWSGLATVAFALLLCKLGPVKLPFSNSLPPAQISGNSRSFAIMGTFDEIKQCMFLPFSPALVLPL